MATECSHFRLRGKISPDVLRPNPSTKRFFGSRRLTSRCNGVHYPPAAPWGGTPMTVATDDFSAWLTQARVSEHRLTPDQRGVLFAAFHFRQSQGDDSYPTRLLS